MTNFNIKYDVNKKIPGKKVKNFAFIVAGVSVGSFWAVFVILALSHKHNKLPGGFEINIPDSIRVINDTTTLKRP